MPKKTQMDFASHLTALREKAGFSRPELATLADMSHDFLWRIETGKSKPGLDILRKLSKALGVDLNTLCGD